MIIYCLYHYVGFNPPQKMILHSLNEKTGVPPETTKKDGAFQPVICFAFNYSDMNQRNNKLGDVGFYSKTHYRCK